MSGVQSWLNKYARLREKKAASGNWTAKRNAGRLFSKEEVMTELEWLIFLWIAIAICALCLAGMAYCTYQIQKIREQRRRDDEMRDWLWRAK